MAPVPSLPYAGGGGEFGGLYLWFVMFASALVYEVLRRGGFEPLCFSSAKSSGAQEPLNLWLKMGDVDCLDA